MMVLPSTTRSQKNLDTLFSLGESDRFFTILALFNNVKNDPVEMGKLEQAIRARGSNADKYLMSCMAKADKMFVEGVPNAQQIELAEQQLAGAKQLGNNFAIAKFNYDVSERFAAAGQFNKSFEYNLYCFDELSKDPTGRFYQQGYFLFLLANQYYRFKDYPNAISTGKAAYAAGTRFTPNPAWFLKIAPNLVGVAHLKNGDFDSAYTWLQKTINEASAQNDTAWMGIATGNIGNIHYQQNRLAEAIPYYQKALFYCRKFQLWDNVVAFCSSLAECYMKAGNYEPVPGLIAEAKEATKKDIVVQGYNANQVKLYSVSEKYCRFKGDGQLALRYADSVKKYEIKEQEEYNSNEKIRSEAQLAYRNKELENEVLRREKQQTKVMLYALGTALLLLLIIGILYTKRQRLGHQLRKEKLEKEKLLAKEELKMALTEIKNFTFHITEKNNLIEAYSTEIENLRKENNSITNQQIESLEKLKELTVLTEEEWNQFKTMFNKVHPGYLQRLAEKYPDLTPAETRFMVFTKLNITPKEMTAMLGVSTETIRGIRFRLKKKLNLEDGSEIEVIVREV